MCTDLPIRKIIHIDMDAFYASVEQLDHPNLRGKPLAVGGNSSRGVVSAASYEARKYGVRSAMSGVLAAKLCPDLIFVKPRFDRYKQISKKIRAIFLEYSDLVEPLSLDEAYIDVTENKKELTSASVIAREIRERIFKQLQLTASAGISINKFMAKVASDFHKPNGQKTIPPAEVLSFLEVLDIRKFHGIGKVTADRMYGFGIFTGKDLKSKSIEFLDQHFGKMGRYYYDVVRGVHKSRVVSNRTPKSLAAEQTFSTNLSSEVYLVEKLELISAEVSSRLERANVAGKTVTLKIKYSDFKQQTRSKTLTYYIKTSELILETSKALLFQEKLRESVRLIGISISNLNNSPELNDKAQSISAQLNFKFL